MVKLKGALHFLLGSNYYNKEAKKNPRTTQYIWLTPAYLPPLSLRQTSDILKRCATYTFCIKVNQLII